MTDEEIEEIGKQKYTQWRQRKNIVNALTAKQLEDLNFISMIKHGINNEQRKIYDIDGSHGYVSDVDYDKYYDGVVDVE